MPPAGAPHRRRTAGHAEYWHQQPPASSTICPDLSARIVTHVLMSTGHFPAAIATASSHAARVEREPAVPTPEGLSVRGSSCCAGRSQPPRTASATSI